MKPVPPNEKLDLGEPYCGACGQRLTGLVDSSKCPECGRPIVDVVTRAGKLGNRYRSQATLFGLPLLDIAFGGTHDEPVGSLSQYAGYCIARATRETGIPVTLNGQGGDEVFSAYWQCYFAHLLNLVQERHPVRLAQNLLAPLLRGGNRELFFQINGMARRYRARRRPQRLLRAARSDPPSANATRGLSLSREQRRIWEITELTLPRLLKWDDRNFMAFAVEGRYPFLDHRLIEICLSFEPSSLYWRGWTKEPLRRGLRDLIPESIARRRTKVGFETPAQAWMRTPLQAVIQEHLDQPGLVGSLIDIASARELLDKVRANRADREETDAVFRVFNAIRWSRQKFAA